LKPLHQYAQEEIRNFNKLNCGEIKVREDLFKNLDL